MYHQKFAILWDLDGTIIDSKECHYRSWKWALEKQGYPFSQADFEENFGRNNQMAIKAYLGFTPDPELAERIMEEKEALFRERVIEEGSLVPGVRTWLEEAKNHRFPQLIASSAPMKNIKTTLAGFGLQSYFDRLVSGAALPAKPEPAVFLKASRDIGYPPERCLVIEDSPPGVNAAKNAGMPCIAVATSGNANALSAADLVIEDFNVPFNRALFTVMG